MNVSMQWRFKLRANICPDFFGLFFIESSFALSSWDLRILFYLGRPPTPASNRIREILKSRKSVREIAIIIHLLLNELKAHCPADIWLGHLGMLIPVGIQEKLWRLQSYNHNHQQYTCGGDLICPIFPSYSWLQGLFLCPTFCIFLSSSFIKSLLFVS